MTEPDDPTTKTPENPAEEPLPLGYPNLIAWVTEWLLMSYIRPLSRSNIFCPNWWEHPEAVIRLGALWRGYEEIRRSDGLSMSSWLRDHLDYHLSTLTAPDGPFARCSRGHNCDGQLTPFPVTRPPLSMTILLV